MNFLNINCLITYKNVFRINSLFINNKQGDKTRIRIIIQKRFIVININKKINDSVKNNKPYNNNISLYYKDLTVWRSFFLRPFVFKDVKKFIIISNILLNLRYNYKQYIIIQNIIRITKLRDNLVNTHYNFLLLRKRSKNKYFKQYNKRNNKKKVSFTKKKFTLGSTKIIRNYISKNLYKTLKLLLNLVDKQENTSQVFFNLGFKLTFFQLNDYFLQLVGIFGRYNALLKIRRGFLFFKGRTLKRTIFKYLRFHLDNKIKDVIMQGHINVEGRINNFWIKDKQKIKSLSSFFKHFKFYKSWRPFSYLYKKYKIYFNWGDREIFHRYPIYRRKYTISFYYPRFQDYRHLFKNQIKHQHLFRWLFKLKYKQLVQQFKKAALKTKRVFELIYLNFYEMRIDVLIYRLNFAWSIKQAGQWVNRSFFKVNWKIINWRNYHVIIGDIIYPIDNLRFSKLYKQSWIKKKLKITSSYSSVNNKTKDSKFKHLKKSHNIIKIVQDHYLNLRLFYRYIQGDQYPSYLIFQERIPAGLIWTMPDPTKVRHHSYFSIQYITLSLNIYS